MTPTRAVLVTAALSAAATACLGLASTSADAATASSSATTSPTSTSLATSTAAPSPTAAACDKSPWAGRIQGEPANFSSGDRGGDYLWHDTSGFHLRVTHKNDGRAVYTGVITSSSAMRLDPVRLERGDVVTLSANHRTLSFSFVDYGQIDGVNFHTDCAASLTVSRLHVGNADLPTSRVYLGATKAHPADIPFTVHRSAVPSTVAAA